MKFSIIIPVYKVEKYLYQCVDSVLAQTFQDYEIILVDDGSPDKCPAVCDEYAARDNRVKVIHKTNGGLSDARNAGLDMAQGEYVIFLDSDDWWDDSDALAKVNSAIESTGSDAIIIGMKKYFTQDDKIGDIRIPEKCDIPTMSDVQVTQKYMQKNIFVACACDKIIRKDIIESDHLRFVKGQYSEDIEWCCKLLMKDIRIDVLEEAFYVYRQQVSTSITANIGIKNISSILDVISRYAQRDAYVPLLHFLANQYVLLITNFMRLSNKERKPLEGKIKSFWWLMEYNWYPYVKSVSRIKIFGFDVTKRMLRVYYLLKRI